jgi:hypothetical protein
VVTRTLLRWLLHSRRRFYTVLICALTIVVGASRLPDAIAATSAPAAAPEIVVVPAPEPQSSAPAAPPEVTPAAQPRPPMEVAQQFAVLWAAPQTPSAQWLAQLLPLATEEYGAVVLAQVDPRNVPAQAVAGPARLVSRSEGTVVVAVPLDSLSIRIEVVDVGGGDWRVADVQPLAEA